MPVKKSAEKALRQSKKRAYLNKRAKEQVKDLAKKTRKAIIASSEESKELIKKTLKATDKLVSRGVIKKNTASRKKSRLMKKFNEKFGNKQKDKKIVETDSKPISAETSSSAKVSENKSADNPSSAEATAGK